MNDRRISVDSPSALGLLAPAGSAKGHKLTITVVIQRDSSGRE
jgi:hypothetical protein